MAETINTKMSYMYRDACNYKSHAEVILNGRMSDAQAAEILGTLDDGEYFIPEAVGLDAPRESVYDFDVDHPYWELKPYDFKDTDKAPTTDITPEELVKSFKEMSGKWTDYAVTYEDTYQRW